MTLSANLRRIAGAINRGEGLTSHDATILSLAATWIDGSTLGSEFRLTLAMLDIEERLEEGQPA